MPTARKNALTLRFFEGPRQEGPFGISDRVVLGRSSDCGICIDHPTVSGAHLAISPQRRQQWRVMDLGSTNGTYLNEMRIEPDEPITLHNRSLLGFGDWTFGVEIPAETAPPVEVERVDLSGSIDDIRTRESLLVRLRSPDLTVREIGWTEFMDCYRPVILGFARNLGLPLAERDDIAQEVIAKFFESDFQYDPSRRLRGFLKKMTRNAIIDHYRRTGAERRRLEAIGTVVQRPDEVDRQWDLQWALGLIRRAMTEVQRQGRITEQSWHAFRLMACERMSAEEAATILGISAVAVRQSKSRVQRKVEKVIRRIHALEG